MKKLVILFCCALCVLFAGCYVVTNQTKLENYEAERAEYGYACEFMPELGDLGNYGDIAYRRKTTVNYIFESNAMSLFVSYDQTGYDAQKQKISETYTFIEQPVTDDGGNYLIPVTQLNLNGYSFRITPVGYDFSACKSFGLIGFNDDENKLCYAYFYDNDLDYICEPDHDPEEKMIEFMQRYFEWI